MITAMDRSRDALSRAWRRTGADWPGGDPLPAHRVPTEGYLWRFTLPALHQVVTVGCTVNRHRHGTWSSAVLAREPGALLRYGTTIGGHADPDTLAVSAGNLLSYRDGRLIAQIGDARLDVTISPIVTWPCGTLFPNGVVALLPFLRTYWHPYLLQGRISGELTIGDETTELTGAQVYAEKSWGRGFPVRSWWGQAHGFPGTDLCVAYGAAPLPGPGPAVLASCVVRLGATGWHLPALTNYATRREHDGGWTMTLRGPQHRIRLDGHLTEPPLPMPLPVPAERVLVTAPQALRGTLRLRVHRGTWLLLDTRTDLAGQEAGTSRRPEEISP